MLRKISEHIEEIYNYISNSYLFEHALHQKPGDLIWY